MVMRVHMRAYVKSILLISTSQMFCLLQPVNQGRHYQKEMNPPSPSNPRDWLNMLSPPIVPPSQQPAEQHPDSSGSLSAQGGNMKNTMHKKYK